MHIAVPNHKSQLRSLSLDQNIRANKIKTMAKEVQSEDHTAIHVEKKSIAISSNCVDTSAKRSRCSTHCRCDHKRSKDAHRYITCIREAFLLLKILLFLHRQSDQITAIALTLISSLNLGSTPLSQLPNIFAMLCGGYKVELI
jgi:hypothetical protein